MLGSGTPTDPHGAHGHQTAPGRLGSQAVPRGMTYSALNERDTDRRSGDSVFSFA
jgi:hypothetical protein